jgi:hypothetical protein
MSMVHPAAPATVSTLHPGASQRTTSCPDVEARVAEHLAGAGSPLVRAAIAASVRVDLVATIPGSRYLERRLKRWHKTGQFCPRCRAARGGKARRTPSGENASA